MSIAQHLSTLALKPLLDGACKAVGLSFGETAVEGVAQFLRVRLFDQSQKTLDALQKAADCAWKTLEIALAGESLWNLFDRADEKALRQQVRAFLDATPLGNLASHGPEFRQVCLRELRAAHKAGLLSGQLDPAQLTRGAGGFARFADPQSLLHAEWQAIELIASACKEYGHANLAQFVALKTDGPDGTPLLIVAVRYFFRRAVETEPELYQSMTWAKLEALQAGQTQGLSQLADLLQQHGDQLDQRLASVQEVVVQTHQVALDIQSEVQQLAKRFDLLQRELKPRDSLSIGNDGERQLVKQLIARYRALPEEQRHQLPSLLNAIGKLEIATGAFDAAQRDFEQAATLTTERAALAETQHNIHTAALERGDHAAALAALRKAVELDGRYAPFPLHKYEPERILGAGGFGVAFLCRNKHSGSRVVVKSLRGETLERSLVDVFREAQLLEELEHPAIIRLRDCDYADAAQTRPYLVMDYFEGQTLAEHIDAHGPLPPDAVLALMQPIAEALQAAHARGIFHRDVKPANLLVRREANGGWRVKLIDFGLALKQSVLQGSVAASQQGKSVLGYSITGTLDYAAPEQLGRLPGVPIGPYTDVFGLGKTCCHALFKTVQPLRKHWRDIPEPLADLLEHCLSEQPKERLPDFQTLLQRLAKLKVQPTRDTPAPPTIEPTHVGPLPSVLPVRTVEPTVASVLPAPRKDWWKAAPATDAPAWSRMQLERVLSGHTDAVHCAAFSPDGKHLLTGSADNTLQLWDVVSGTRLAALRGHTGKIWSVAFLADGQRAVSASKDKSVRLWNLAERKQQRVFAVNTNRSVAVASDGQLALSGSLNDGMIRVWEVASCHELRRCKGHMSWVLSLALSPDNRHALSSSADGTVRLWEVASGREVRRMLGHKDQVWQVQFVPHSNRALSCSADRTVRLWDLGTGKELRCEDGYADQVWSVAVSPDGSWAASDADGYSVRVWSLQHGQVVQPREHHDDKVLCVAFAPDGRRLVTGGLDKTLRLWTLE